MGAQRVSVPKEPRVQRLQGTWNLRAGQPEAWCSLLSVFFYSPLLGSAALGNPGLRTELRSCEIFPFAPAPHSAARSLQDRGCSHLSSSLLPAPGRAHTSTFQRQPHSSKCHL